MQFQKNSIPPEVKNEFEFIGRGFFSYAYKQGNNVYLRSKCPYKEAMSLFLEDHPNLPIIESLHFCDENGYKWYVMPFYVNEENKRPSVITSLAKSYSTFIANYFWEKDIAKYSNLSESWLKTIEGHELYEPLNMLLECSKNYDSACSFEFNKRNIANHNSNIILRDVIFSKLTFNEIILERKLKKNDNKKNE